MIRIARFLSISASNFCNANNNGNANNNNASNVNGIVPDLTSRTQHESCDNGVMGKETETCGLGPKSRSDASHASCGSRYQRYSFSQVHSPESLLAAYYQCRKGVTWKYSVQNYERRLLKNISDTMKILQSGGRVTRGFKHFVLRERGKVRNISSVHISERVVQRSLCDNALVPMLAPKLIYDSGASIKGKGTKFARRRMKVQLLRHYRKHGSDGYVLTMDCRKYFDSIPHDKLFLMLDGVGFDDETLNLTKGYISDFGTQGLGLGSQVSQICSVFYISKIDQYVKSQLRISNYGRYMDDSNAIVPTIEDARALLDDMKRLYSLYDLTLNDCKTHIVKLTRGFTYLKMQFKLTKSGKVITRPSPDSKRRMARKLRKFDKLGMSEEEIKEAYESWRGYWVSINGNPLLTDRIYEGRIA